MEFTNHTPFPAKFLNGSTGEREMVGIVASKATFQLEADRLIPITGEDAWPVFDKPYGFEDVLLGPETDFRKRATDILVFGKARSPGGEPVSSMTVSVTCGSVTHRAAVFGDRVWRRGPSGTVPSDPVPFTEMPITNERAFGGPARLNDAEIQHGVNPAGRGLLYMEDDVEGTALPNLEDPEARILDWNDKPRPLCFFKPMGHLSPRGQSTQPAQDVAQSAQDVAREMMVTAFNQAVPELTMPMGQRAETLRLTGFSTHGDLVFPLPDPVGPSAHVRVGDLHSRFPSQLSTIIALADERVLITTYIALFRYLVRPEEERRVDLRWPGGPAIDAAVSQSDDG